MGFLTNFIPFYPRKTPKYDLERALRVELHAHPNLERHRAQNGELILVTDRELYGIERLLARWFPINRKRRIVLDRYGEFMLDQCLAPGATLADAAAKLAQEFDLEPEKAKLGVVQLVRDLMLRGFVFLVRK
jgi:hypothetical protein